jgi:hypothetical protein
MHLAGVPLRDEIVLELARLVDDYDLDSILEDAYGRVVKVFALTITERETIIRALVDCPDELTELRALLVAEFVARNREGWSEARTKRYC